MRAYVRNENKDYALLPEIYVTILSQAYLRINGCKLQKFLSSEDISLYCSCRKQKQIYTFCNTYDNSKQK